MIRDYGAEYRAIVGGLAPADVDTLWSIALGIRRRTLPAHLEPAFEQLEALRDRVGRASAARSNLPKSA